jgi:hypothetical protein
VATEHPQDSALKARGNASNEQGRRCIVVEAGAYTGGFVQSGAGQPSARQPLVHVRNSERQ